MGICNLKIGTGPVNTLNYLHVTASKVSSPTVVVWETWFQGPFASKNFIIPNLDPENYFIRYYFSVDAASLGIIQLEQVVNALTSEYAFEKRLYRVGGTGAYDPVDGAASLTDPYLIDKNVTGVFKEAFRYLIENTEYQFNATTGTISKLDGINFGAPETIIVEIKYNVASTANAVGTGTGMGLYSGILTVTAPTQTLLPANRNNLIRCSGSLAKQTITLPLLSSINVDDGFYFDNSVVRSAVQVKVLTQGADRINFTGFNTTNILFQEFWVSLGEHLLLRKLDNNLWEVRSDYKGVNVGMRMSGRYAAQANYLPEDNRLLDGDEYGRLWYYIKNILPSTHYIIDDNVTNTSYVPVRERCGMFTVHSTQKKFRMPLTGGLTERGLLDFNNYGTDTGRTVDYPGGFQDEMITPHDHFLFTEEAANGNPPYMCYKKSYNNAATYTMFSDNSKQPTVGKTSKSGGIEGRLKNVGVIYSTHI